MVSIGLARAEELESTLRGGNGPTPCASTLNSPLSISPSHVSLAGNRDERLRAGAWPHPRGAPGAAGARARLPAGLDFANVEVSPPRDAAHGDLASNAALVLAKAAQMKPRDIADQLAAKLKARCRLREGRGGRPGISQYELRAGLLAGRRRRRSCRRAAPMAASTSARASASMSSTSRPTRPARCMSAIAAARCSAMRWPTCCSSPAMRLRANTTSTMPAGRSMRSPARPTCATARRWARTSARSRTGCIPATT